MDMDMDIFNATHFDMIKQGLVWFLDTDQIGEDGLSFELASKDETYAITIKAQQK